MKILFEAATLLLLDLASTACAAAPEWRRRVPDASSSQ
jgi:hypothetical protein